MAYADADLVIDFYADWIAILRGELSKRGYENPSAAQDVEIAYFNLRKRLVRARPRNVHEAPTLTCPNEVRVGYDEVVRKVRAGEDVRAHLSRGLAKRDFHDLLLNDWGIHHLHLSTALEPDGFVKRSGPVLFARFGRKDAYFIAVKQHGSGEAPWTDITVLETFAESWPEQMERYELRGLVRSSETNPSAKELASARKAGVQPIVAIKGKYYMPLGGGISTARVGVAVVDAMDRHAMTIRRFEENVVGGKDKLFAEAEAAKIELPRPLQLKLVVRDDGSAMAVTEDWAFGVQLGSLPNDVT